MCLQAVSWRLLFNHQSEMLSEWIFLNEKWWNTDEQIVKGSVQIVIYYLAIFFLETWECLCLMKISFHPNIEYELGSLKKLQEHPCRAILMCHLLLSAVPTASSWWQVLLMKCALFRLRFFVFLLSMCWRYCVCIIFRYGSSRLCACVPLFLALVMAIFHV